MPRFVITDASGNQVYEYVADAALLDMEMFPSPPFVHAEIAEPPAPRPAAVYGGRRILTQLEFLRLFTQQERVTIRVFAQGDSQYQLAVRDFMYLLELAQEINLDDAETQVGVPQLEALGLLSTGRAAEILNG